MPAGIIAAIANGFRSSVIVPQNANAPAFYDWLRRAASQLALQNESTELDSQNWSEAHNTAQQCLEALKTWIPAASGATALDAAWRAVDAWIASPIVWDAPDPFADDTRDALLLASANSLQGVVAHVAMTAGLQRYRALLPEGREAAPERNSSRQTRCISRSHSTARPTAWFRRRQIRDSRRPR